MVPIWVKLSWIVPHYFRGLIFVIGSRSAASIMCCPQSWFSCFLWDMRRKLSWCDCLKSSQIIIFCVCKKQSRYLILDFFEIWRISKQTEWVWNFYLIFDLHFVIFYVLSPGWFFEVPYCAKSTSTVQQNTILCISNRIQVHSFNYVPNKPILCSPVHRVPNWVQLSQIVPNCSHCHCQITIARSPRSAAHILGCTMCYGANLSQIELNCLKLFLGTHFCDRI